ncbi:hypothetical protein [Pontibacter diazotrophicus]|nr:hypothetical protein [Pontibacter diazotrophicus]
MLFKLFECRSGVWDTRRPGQRGHRGGVGMKRRGLVKDNICYE